ncbi:hypothetical protein [Streptomyces xanthochromogenes]
MIARGAFTTALATLLATASGKPVGRGRTPGGPPPYYLLTFIDQSVSGAPLADLNEDASLVYQVTCVSGPDPARAGTTGSQEQVDWLADRARAAILGRNPDTGQWVNALTVPGMRVMSRELELEPGESSDPADAIMSSVIRFRFDLTST